MSDSSEDARPACRLGMERDQRTGRELRHVCACGRWWLPITVDPMGVPKAWEAHRAAPGSVRGVI